MTMANVPPVWLAKTDENLFELEHIETANTLDLPTDLTITDTSNGTLVGEWGEQLVKNYLDKCRDQAGSDIAEIQHVNFACETGLPYDFVVVKKSGRKIYLEVKTTASAEKTYFQISINSAFVRTRERFGVSFISCLLGWRCTERTPLQN